MDMEQQRMMQTEILCCTTEEEIKKAATSAAEQLLAGQVVAIPTETVYGLAADATNEAAVKEIFRVKGRPQDNPLIVHISDLSMLPLVTTAQSEDALRLFEAFWPGPLTVILPRADSIPAAVSAGLDTVAVRFPAHFVAQQVIACCNKPLAAPSANRSGIPSPTTAQHVMDDLSGRIPLILDGGSCSVGVESTVITLCTENPRILRPGFVTKEQLEEVLGKPVEVDEACLKASTAGQAVSSPGMKYKHYAPKTALTLVQGSLDDYISYAKANGFTAAFCFEEEVSALSDAGFTCVAYGRAGDDVSQAASLFDALRRLDELGVSSAVGRMPSKDGVGLAVTKRLIRAAAFRVVDAKTGASLSETSTEQPV